MQQPELLPHLFRTEFGKITAVLCKLFGIEHLTVAEDIAGETFLAALESWPYKGIPEQPAAWLYTVAKNKARNYIKRHQLYQHKVVPKLQDAAETDAFQLDMTPEHITDSQLQMIFAICHPAIPPEAQIGLALRILCGFGIDEIANAFLTSKDTINKRLYRAKEKLRQERVDISLPPETEMADRLGTVLATLYLLFNEGYYSESKDSILREELCLEAMRLAYMLSANPHTARPEVHALLALMCFHASRFPARKDANGQIVLYNDQDENLWDQQLIARGAHYLHKASTGERISRYHLEAGIAYWHTHKANTPEKWEAILQLYNRLLQVAYSPVAALNRTYALAKVKGNEAAIIEAEKLKLNNNHYYFTLLGELYQTIDPKKALECLQRAKALAITQTDKQLIAKKLTQMGG